MSTCYFFVCFFVMQRILHNCRVLTQLTKRRKKSESASSIQTKIIGKIKINGYIWLWLTTLEGSGDNRGGLWLFITIQTLG